MVGVNNNCFALNKEKVDQKNPAKIVNPHGWALQISTSDIQTIKSIMKYAAENGQEITVIIPMRKTKNVTACPHYDRKHYAKNMCSACYNKNGRTKKAWVWGHPDKIHYAKGLCQFWYLAKYHKENSSNK